MQGAGWKCSGPLIALIVAASTVSRGQILPATSPTTENSMAIQPLIKDLASDQYEKREAAQRAMEKLPLSQLDNLRKSEAATGDAEVKARLRTIIHAMEVEIATTVPLVSVNLKDAQMPEVAAALSKATGVSTVASNPDEDRFTLQAQNMPLWEVIRQLSEQHSLGVGLPTGAMTVGPLPAPDVRHRQFTRGILFSVDDPQFIGGQLSCTLAVALDPRIHAVSLGPPVLDEIVDNLNHSTPSDDLLHGIGGVDESESRNICSQPVSVNLPATTGNRVTLRGHATMVLPLKEETAEFADVAKQVHEPIATGDCVLTLRQMILSPAEIPGPRALGLLIEGVPKDSKDVPPNRGEMTIVDGAVRIAPELGKAPANPPHWIHMHGLSITQDNELISDGCDQTGTGNSPITFHGGILNNTIQLDGNTESAPPTVWIEVVVIDATDKEVMSVKIPSGSTTTTVAGSRTEFKEPLKMIVRRPTQTVEVTMPFEFKDLALRR